MARFRRKARSRSSFKRYGKARRSRGKSGISPMGMILPAALYGAGRGALSNLIAPLTSKIPLGNYTDEAVFGVAGYLMAKKGRGIIKQLGTSMLVVEAASIGNQVAGGALGGSTSGASTSYTGWQ